MFNPTVFMLASDGMKILMLQSELDKIAKKKGKQAKEDADMLRDEIAKLKKHGSPKGIFNP